jgi:hypothetical protein
VKQTSFSAEHVCDYIKLKRWVQSVVRLMDVFGQIYKSMEDPRKEISEGERRLSSHLLV